MLVPSSGSVKALIDDSFRLLHQLLRHYSSAESWIIVAGSPCQGFSSANPYGAGFKDHRSQLLWTIPAIIGELSRAISFMDIDVVVHFIVENVIPRTKAQRRVFDLLLQTAAIMIDSGSFSGIARPRLWWTSFPLDSPSSPSPSLDLLSFLSPPWRPLWELYHGHQASRRFGTRLRPCDPHQPAECPLPWRRFPLTMYGLNHLVYRSDASPDELQSLRQRVHEGITLAPPQDARPPHVVQEAVDRRVNFAHWLHLEGGSSLCRCLSPSEVEIGMCYPPDSSLPPASSLYGLASEDVVWLRHTLLGNAFSAHSISHVLSPLEPLFSGHGLPPAPRDFSTMVSDFAGAQVLANQALRPSPSLPSNGGR